MKPSRGSLALCQIVAVIKDFRKITELTLTETAARMGIEHPQLSKILGGKGGLSLRQAEMMANCIGMSLEEMLRKGRFLMEKKAEK